MPWPTFGFDVARAKVSPFDHRPPYRELADRRPQHARVPPSVAYGHVYLAQQKGLFFAINAKTGVVEVAQEDGRCSASSPTVRDHVVYQAWMDFVDCPPPARRDWLHDRLERRHR